MAKKKFGSLVIPALWALGAAAFWLVPDQKIIRAKLLTVESVILLAGMLLVSGASRRDSPKGFRSPLDLPVMALAAAGLFFWALSPDLAASQAEAARLLFCGLAFWTASRSFALTGPGTFLTAWGACASAAGLWAIGQAVSGQARPFASFGNPIFLGTALASALPITFARTSESNGARRIAWAAAAFVQGTALLLTGSRAALFGLLTGLALWTLARLQASRLAKTLGALAALAAMAAWTFREREQTHVLIWRDALALWRAHPLLGCGLGRFHIEFPAFASAALKARWHEGEVIINFAHNEYLQTVVETGLIGLTVLLTIPIAAWLLLRRDDVSEGRLDRGAATAGALALFAAAFVSPDLRFGASAFASFTLLAAGSRAKEGASAPPVALPLITLCAFFGIAVQAPLAARRNAAETPFSVGVSSPLLREAENRLARSPNDANAAEELGFLKAKAADFDGARAAFRRAAELAPSKPGPLNNLGNLAYLAGNFDGAIAWWKKSLSAAPEQIDARLNLAKLLYERGRLKECSQHLDEVLRREPMNAKARVLYKKMVE